jgi:TonB-linked SusC/RagA family outer membrane protein
MSTDRTINLSNSAYLTYEKTFAVIHRLTLMVGHDYQSNNYEGFSASAKGFPNDSWIYWALGTATTALNPSSGTGSWKMEGIYARLNYSLKDRYLFTFTGRQDGSSRFGADNKWAFFPSAAVRWNVKKESFLKDINAISDLSLHAGYGTNGNTDIGSYQSLATLNGNGIYDYVNGIRVVAVVPTSVANTKLSWESTVMTNAGADISLLNGKVNFSGEFYNKETTGLLYTVPLPKYSGFENMLQNIGKFRNRGVELTLGTNLTKGDFNWSSDFNISFNKTTVVKLPNGDLIAGYSPLNNTSMWILREGETTNSFWGYVYKGVYQQGNDIPAGEAVGHAKYADINGRDANGKLTGQPDGKIDSDDKTIIGNANPDFTFGWTNDFVYKGFDLNIQMTGSYGNQMVNATRIELESMYNPDNTTRSAYADAWTPSHTNTDVPLIGSETQFTYSSRWVENASFLRVQNIALGYSLPASVTNVLKISKCRLYVSVQNALILTKYSGYDPEVTWNPANSTLVGNVFRGMDYDAYPKTRNYTMGINITF